MNMTTTRNSTGAGILKRRTLIAAGAMMSLCSLFSARADTYPSKPVRLIVPFAPGGTSDIIARIVAERIQETLGQPMIVENKAGGGGSVGALEIARASPDLTIKNVPFPGG